MMNHMDVCMFKRLLLIKPLQNVSFSKLFFKHRTLEVVIPAFLHNLLVVLSKRLHTKCKEMSIVSASQLSSLPAFVVHTTLNKEVTFLIFYPCFGCSDQ